MKKYTAKELVNEGYTLENALITSVSLSRLLLPLS